MTRPSSTPAFTGLPVPPPCGRCLGEGFTEVEVEKEVTTETVTPTEVTGEDGAVTTVDVIDTHTEVVTELKPVTCPRCGGRGLEPPPGSADPAWRQLARKAASWVRGLLPGGSRG